MSEPADVSEGGSVLVEPALDISQSAAAAISGDVNRYPGSPPFGDTEVDRLLFRGRALETDEVLHSILSYDLYLVYAVSGMGKTSLLTAGVLEPLRQRDYFPVIVRLNSPTTGFLALIEAQIRQAGEAGGVEIEHAQPIGAIPTTPETLWDLLAHLQLWRGNELQQLVLIFDQFEELFTLPWSSEQRSAFITQFGEVIRRHRVPSDNGDASRQAMPPPNVKVVLCMREDFIGQLEELAVSVPQIMHRRFRLGALTPEQAQAAICEPAALDDPRLRTQRFSYSEGAASTILTFLRTKDERGKSVLTGAVDPSQLQIICQHVERSILPTKAARPDGVVEITEGDLGGQDGLRRIVGDFYRRVLEEFQPKERKAIRHLCETGLISQTGRRLSQEEGEIYNHFDVTSDTLRKLVDLRLLRSEPRVGSVYYELAHDTLTGPILAYRDAQRKRRRRRLVIAALILAGLAAAVLAALLLSGRDSNNAGGVEAPTPIAIGDSVTGELTSAEDSVVYELGSAGQTLLVELRPSGFNGLLEVSRLGATTPPQLQNVGMSGAPEFAVIQPGDDRYRITVSGLGSGEFELTVRRANTRQLAIPGRLRNMRLAASGEPAVFEIEGSDTEALAVTVFASDGRAFQPVPDGAHAQVIGSDGVVVNALRDDIGVLSLVAGGKADTYTLTIGDTSGETKLTYTVAVQQLGITPAPIGGLESVSLSEAQPHAVFEVRPPGDRALFVQLQDDQGVASAEIRTPDDGVVSLMPGSYSVFDRAAGRFLIFVSSASPAEVTLAVDAVAAIDIGLDETLNGSLGGDRRVALYRVQAPGDVSLVADVTPDATLDPVLGVMTSGESAVEQADFALDGDAEQLVIPAGSGGAHLFAVTPYGDTLGTFQFAVRRADVRALVLGETVEDVLDSGELALYTVTATDATPFAVAVTSGSDLSPFLDVEGPEGDEFAQTDALFVSNGGSGTYTFTVRGFDSAGSFRISADKPNSVAVAEDVSEAGAIREFGDVEVFEVDVPPDPLTFVTITTDGDLEVDATITNAFGNVVAFASTTIAGADTITVADPDGPHRIAVTGISGSGTVRVIARAVRLQPLAPGSEATASVSGSGDVAAFAVEASDGLRAIDVRPSPGVAVNAKVEDGFGTVLIEGRGASTDETTLIVDGRLGPVQVVASVAAGRGEVRVGSRQLEPSAFALGQAVTGSIRSPTDVAAYEVLVGDLENLQLLVTTPDVDFDPEIIVVDPFGFPVVTDDGGAGEDEEASLDSGAGVYRVVISGYQATTGEFEASLELLPFVEDDMLAAIAANLES